MSVIPRPPSVSGLRDYFDELAGRLEDWTPETAQDAERRDDRVRELREASAALEQVDVSGAVSLIHRAERSGS